MPLISKGALGVCISSRSAEPKMHGDIAGVTFGLGSSVPAVDMRLHVVLFALRLVWNGRWYGSRPGAFKC